MSPLSSAIGMKRVGDTGARDAGVQRRRASRDTTRPDTMSMMGWYSRCSSSRSSATRNCCSSASRSATRSRIDLSKTATSSRPQLFATYIALSASRIRLSASVMGYLHSANETPTLAVTNVSDWRTVNGSRKERRTRSAIPVARSTDVSFRTIANSSPPILATRSSARTVARRRRATSMSSSSPKE